MIRQLLFLCCFCSPFFLSAQNTWVPVAPAAVPRTGLQQIVPQQYKTIQFDLPKLQALLWKAPDPAGSFEGTCSLDLPLPDGQIVRFQLHTAPLLAPELQARYPEIRCYTGVSASHPGARIRCDLTQWGFHAMITGIGPDVIYFDPMMQGVPEYAMVYHRSDYQVRADADYTCALTAQAITPNLLASKAQARSAVLDGQLRTYRLALACTGEYADFHGGTVPLVMAAMATSMHRINGVYENEFAVRMQIIAKNDTLINLVSGSDPYDNGDGGTMLGQNKIACNTRVGSSAYDIGHVFSTGGGGIAGLGVVCTGDKAHGVTGQAAPIGDPFDIDYVAHEMGHQFSGNHTQNNDCNRAGQTSMEPGSATTIMGYAGICPPNVQPNSDPYFHGVNVEEILGFIIVGDGNNCPVKTATGNMAPEVNAGADFTIPRGTPFVLTALGSDIDSDSLTYCWEQMDADASTQPPVSTSALGPLFRTFNPSTAPSRFFPRFQDVIDQKNDDWEELPGVGRKMNFRVTMRDNDLVGGSTVFDDMLVTVAANAGPFVVNIPSDTSIWTSGAYETVNWNVANTDRAPVNCTQVNISLSINGGKTFPYLLLQGAPNTGRACVLLPEVASDSAIIKVESVGNVFYNLSKSYFALKPGTAPTFSFCPGDLEARICLPGNFQTTLSTRSLAGFNQPISFEAQGLPDEAIVVFSPNPVMPGDAVQLDINFPNGTAAADFDFSILAKTDSINLSETVRLRLISNNFDAMALKSPINGISGVSQGVILRWNGAVDAEYYEVQLASSPGFDASTLISTKLNVLADTFKVPLVLPKSQVYYWRVRPINECGAGPWIGPNVFATIVQSCNTRTANDLPKVISGGSTPTVESKITVNGGGTISDVNIIQLKGFHEFFRDLQATLISPQGTQVILFKDKCANYNGSFNLGLDDAAPGAFPCPPANNGLFYNAQNPLAPFNGENSTGVWTLRVKDNTIGSGGSITDFKLEICGQELLPPPILVQNNVLQVSSGANQGIESASLLAEDANNTADQLVFTMLTVPQKGLLQKNATNTLQVGDQFTQTDINNGGLRYFDYGLNTGADAFRFAVTDGEGGLVADTFVIQPLVTATEQPRAAFAFSLSPNPAQDAVLLTAPESFGPNTRVTLLNMAGVSLHNWSPATGSNQLMLPLNGIPAAMYMVRIDSEKGTGVQKLVVH
jgi:subtilisin-like proprotein convertase family protein